MLAAMTSLIAVTVLMNFALLWMTSSTDGHKSYAFMDPELSWDDRVQDLVSRLTVDEITEQMARGGRTTYAPGIPRLGIGPYPWGTECLRGDVEAGPATSFPQAIGLAATFSKEVMFNVSRATGLEVRAKFNNYTAHHYLGQHSGASCWSPVINIMRDPRWGRNQETYGEDPFLSGELSAAFVHGLQGHHPRYILANAGCKHYDAYGGPENFPVSRHKFDAKVSQADLRNTFLPAFRSCVQAGTYSLMCSYNSVNGVPACANKQLLTDILRSEWGFTGYVISDEGAIEDIMDHHNYTSTPEDTAAAAVLAGTNLEDGPARKPPYFNAISKAVQMGKLSASTIREAVKPLFYTRMRLGLFDPPYMNPYSNLTVSDVVQSLPHRELAILAALRSFVLLKNDGTLPIDKSPAEKKALGKIAIVGPMGDNKGAMFGNYAPQPDPRWVRTPVQELSTLASEASFTAGCVDGNRCTIYDENSTRATIENADLVVVCLGTGPAVESESRDRQDLKLPGKQLQLLQDAVTFAKGAPVVLVLFNGGPLDISWAVSNPGVNVIVECFFPAQGTGVALRYMFERSGEAANPAGRLPYTWPAKLSQYPPITDYTMENRTYRYFEEEPQFPFGYGLSYSVFKYSSLDVSPAVLHFTDVLLVNVYVLNTGPYEGEEVVQLYISWPDRDLPSTPQLQLVDFQRYYIPNRQGITSAFRISVDRLALWNPSTNNYTVPRGTYRLYVGGQQPNQAVTAPSNVLDTTFTVK